jgi:hypothetical protein
MFLIVTFLLILISNGTGCQSVALTGPDAPQAEIQAKKSPLVKAG